MKQPLLLLLMTAVTSQLYAYNSKWRIGLQAGPNRVSLTGSPALSELKSDIRWGGGVMLQYNMGAHVSVRADVGYERKGAKGQNTIVIINTAGNTTGEVTPYLHYDYATFAMLVQYTLGKKVRYFVNAGPYIGYLVSRKDVVKGDNTEPLVMMNSREYDQPLDYGLSLGLGAQLPVSKKISFSIEAKNNIGIYNTVKVPTSGVTTIKTRTAIILLGIRYNW